MNASVNLICSQVTPLPKSKEQTCGMDNQASSKHGKKKKKNLRQSIVVTVHDVQLRLQCICSTVQFFGVVLIVNRDDLNAKHAAASTHILLLAVALNGSNDSLSRTQP